jgi:hypothetical protein
MTYKDRKKLLLELDLTIAGLAVDYERENRKKHLTCSREEMSQCIRGVRVYPELRKFLAKKLDKTEEELFSAPAEAKQAA